MITKILVGLALGVVGVYNLVTGYSIETQGMAEFDKWLEERKTTRRNKTNDKKED